MSLDSIQLIKCRVSNVDNQISYRLIERDHYDLWRYLVSTKHNLKILEASIGLWVNQLEYITKQEIYQRAGESEAANRICLTMYDDDGNFNNTYRYVISSDTDDVERILLSHIPEDVRQLQQYSMVVESGYIVCKGPLKQISLMEFATVEPNLG